MTHMEKPLQFNQKQREMFARLLADARKREEQGLEEVSDLDDRVEREFLPTLVEEAGAFPLIEKIRTLRRDLKEAENALDKLGFSCDEDEISLLWDAPEPLQNRLEAAKRLARKERGTLLKKFDLAILGVWAAQDSQEARRIAEEAL